MLENSRTLKKIELAFAVYSVLSIGETLVGLSAAKKEGADLLNSLSGIIQGAGGEQLSHFIVIMSVLELAVIIGFGWLLVLLLATGRKWAFSLFIPGCYFSLVGNVWSLVFPDESISAGVDRILAIAYFALTVVMVHNARLLRADAQKKTKKIFTTPFSEL